MLSGTGHEVHWVKDVAPVDRMRAGYPALPQQSPVRRCLSHQAVA